MKDANSAPSSISKHSLTVTDRVTLVNESYNTTKTGIIGKIVFTTIPVYLIIPAYYSGDPSQYVFVRAGVLGDGASIMNATSIDNAIYSGYFGNQNGGQQRGFYMSTDYKTLYIVASITCYGFSWSDIAPATITAYW